MADTALVVVENRGGAVEIAGTAYTSPAMAYLAGLSKTGRDTMQGALGKVARLLGYADLWVMPWAQLRYEHVTAIRTKLVEEGLKPATVNKSLCAIRGVLRAAWQMGQIDAEHYHRAAAVKAVTGSTLPAGRGLSPAEIAAMMRATANDHTAAGRRDGAIIALAYGAGLRRAEVAGLDLASIQEDDGETITIKVVGKRNKERLVYLDNGGAQHMRAWLQTRGTEPGALFYSGRRGGHLGKDGMTPQSVMVVVLKRAAEGGVSDVSPHDMRRSFVSDLLDSGVDIATVAAMAGHASIQTTARYDRRGETAKKRAARSLHVPFYGTAM
jgi:site-specific recombinase XerD